MTRFTTEERFSLDTNILVCALDVTAGWRHSTALELVRTAAAQHCVLTLQALCEFYHVAVRKAPCSASEIAAQVRDWQLLFPVVAASPATLNRAIIAASQDHRIPFWDAMLWACVRDAGCTLLLTEDFQHRRELGGVRFLNPFQQSGDFSVGNV